MSFAEFVPHTYSTKARCLPKVTVLVLSRRGGSQHRLSFQQVLLYCTFRTLPTTGPAELYPYSVGQATNQTSYRMALGIVRSALAGLHNPVQCTSPSSRNVFSADRGGEHQHRQGDPPRYVHAHVHVDARRYRICLYVCSAPNAVYGRMDGWCAAWS